MIYIYFKVTEFIIMISQNNHKWNCIAHNQIFVLFYGLIDTGKSGFKKLVIDGTTVLSFSSIEPGRYMIVFDLKTSFFTVTYLSINLVVIKSRIKDNNKKLWAIKKIIRTALFQTVSIICLAFTVITLEVGGKK